MKKILYLLVFVPFALQAQNPVAPRVETDTIDYGTVADDGTGDNAREGAIKINSMAMTLANALDSVLTDTMSLDSAFSWTFVVGGGLAGDTVFAEDDALIGSKGHHYGDTILIYAINAVLKGSSPTLDIEIGWHSSLESGSATLLRTTAFTITSTTTGDTFTSFTNNTMYRGDRLYLKIDDATVGSKPTYFECTIYYRLL